MSDDAKRLCSLMCGRPIERVSDMSLVEAEACLNSWAAPEGEDAQ